MKKRLYFIFPTNSKEKITKSIKNACIHNIQMIKYFLVVPHNPQTRKGILRKTDKIEEEKKDMATNTATLKKDIFIINSLITKDFKIKYRRSVLGILWSVLNPLLMMIIVAAVFSYILRGDDSIPCFPMYLILGQVLFGFCYRFWHGINSRFRWTYQENPRK